MRMGGGFLCATKTLRGFEASPIRGLMVVDGSSGGAGGGLKMSGYLHSVLTASPRTLSGALERPSLATY